MMFSEAEVLKSCILDPRRVVDSHGGYLLHQSLGSSFTVDLVVVSLSENTSSGSFFRHSESRVINSLACLAWGPQAKMLRP